MDAEQVQLTIKRLVRWAEARGDQQADVQNLRRAITESDGDAARWLIDLGPEIKRSPVVAKEVGVHKFGKTLPAKLRSDVVVNWNAATLTQQETATALGISQQTVSNILTAAGITNSGNRGKPSGTTTTEQADPGEQTEPAGGIGGGASAPKPGDMPAVWASVLAASSRTRRASLQQTGNLDAVLVLLRDVEHAARGLGWKKQAGQK